MEKLLRDFAGAEQHHEIAQAKMQRSVRIIEAYFDLPRRIKQLRRCAVASGLEPSATLTTTYKARGLARYFVRPYGDFSADKLAPKVDRASCGDAPNLR